MESGNLQRLSPIVTVIGSYRRSTAVGAPPLHSVDVSTIGPLTSSAVLPRHRHRHRRLWSMSWQYSTVDNSMKVMNNGDGDGDGEAVFRKVWDNNCPYDMTEREICRLLKRHPHKNIVSIYEVTKGHALKIKY